MPNGTCVAGMWEKLERMGTIWEPHTKEKPEPEAFFGEGHYEAGLLRMKVANHANTIGSDFLVFV